MGRAYQNRKESIAKTSDAKAKVYSKYGRELYVCAKSGGVEPEGNLALRSLIEKAKKDQVPSHVIEKAIEKAKGGGGEDFAPARYEGFGPAGSMVIVDCLTDNPNRTIGDVRQCFTKTKCKLGVQGTVSHMFDHYAIFVLEADEEEILEALLMADVDVADIENEDGKITIFAPDTEYFKAKQAILDTLGDDTELEVDDVQFIPQITHPLNSEEVERFEKLMFMLNDLDDVQKVYYSAEI